MPCQGKNGTARSLSKNGSCGGGGKGWREVRGRDECSTLAIIDKTIKREKTFCNTLQMYEITLKNLIVPYSSLHCAHLTMQGDLLCFQTISRVERSRVAIENMSNHLGELLNSRYPLHK